MGAGVGERAGETRRHGRRWATACLVAGLVSLPSVADAAPRSPVGPVQEDPADDDTRGVAGIASRALPVKWITSPKVNGPMKLVALLDKL